MRKHTKSQRWKSIKADVFSGCICLYEVDMPEGVTSIDIKAFEGCNAITIYASVNSYAIEYAKANGIAWEII